MNTLHLLSFRELLQLKTQSIINCEDSSDIRAEIERRILEKMRSLAIDALLKEEVNDE